MLIVDYSSQKNVAEAILNRANCKDWYVLKYDLKTTAYNNEIVFKTLKEAEEEFENTQPSYEGERIEIIFSPEESDEEFFDNKLVKCKTLN